MPSRSNQGPVLISHPDISPVTAARHTDETEMGVFKKLPGELRNRIYRYLLVYDGYVELWKRDKTGHHKLRPFQPALARTCKQIRKEVLQIFYAGNTFVMLGHHCEMDGSYFSIEKKFEGNVKKWVTSLYIPGCDPSERGNYPSLIQNIGVVDEVKLAGEYKMCCVTGKLSEHDGTVVVTCSHSLKGWCECRTFERRIPSFEEIEEKISGALLRCWYQMDQIWYQISVCEERAHCKTCGLFERMAD